MSIIMDPSEQSSETGGGTLRDFNLSEARDALESLPLSSVVLDGHLVVFRSGFDLTISGEPYLALMFLFSFKSGEYYARIWNQTVSKGTAGSVEEVVAACRGHFGGGTPCIGCPESEEGDRADGREYLVSQTPIPRKISLGCRGLLGADADGVQCAECVRLGDDNDGDDGEVTGMVIEDIRHQTDPIDLVSDDEQQDPEEVVEVRGKEEDCQNEPAEPVLEEKEIDDAIEKLTTSVKLPKGKDKGGDGADEEADPSGGRREKENVETSEKGDPLAAASTSGKQKEDEVVILITQEPLTTSGRPSRGQDSSFLCRSCKTSFSGSEKHVCSLRTPFLCTLCFTAFRSEFRLKQHHSTAHELKASSSEQQEVVKEGGEELESLETTETKPDKIREDQGEAVEEVPSENVEKLVDHVNVKQQQQQHMKQPDPPADFTDYASIIEEALLGQEGNKALSLEKINDFVEGHPKADVKMYPTWKDSVRWALSSNHRFKLVPVRRAFILNSEEGNKTYHVKDTFWRLRCDDEKAGQPPVTKGPIFPSGHRGKAGVFRCKGCAREFQHALDLIDHMTAEDHMGDLCVRCPSCANQVRPKTVD